MSTRQVTISAAAVGLVVSLGILALIGSGTAGVLVIGQTDLMYLLWPSSLM